MLNVIKVEREEDLAKAEAPAFCVIGTGQGRVDGRKVKTLQPSCKRPAGRDYLAGTLRRHRVTESI